MTGRRRNLDAARFAWVPILLLLAMFTFVGAAEVGLVLVGIPLLGILFSLGHEVARPIVADARIDRSAAYAVHAALWSYPILFAGVLLWSQVSPTGSFNLDGSDASLFGLLFAIQAPIAVGAVAAAGAILRTRGRPWEFSLWRRLLLFAGGTAATWPLAWLGRGLLRDVLGDDGVLTLWMGVLMLCAMAMVVVVLGSIARILKPYTVRRRRSAGPEPIFATGGQPGRPTFEQPRR